MTTRSAGWFVRRDHHWGPDTDGAVDRLTLDTIQARQRAAVGNEAASRWGAKSLSRHVSREHDQAGSL